VALTNPDPYAEAYLFWPHEVHPRIIMRHH
jgi:hypothetical protein